VLFRSLQAQARKSAVPTTVEADGIARYPQDLEAAVYFCTLEALQNVAKYAQASSAAVRLRRNDGTLEFEVEDDGRGFDRSTASLGSGLQGMIDRLDAVGGTVEIESSPSRGTLVRGAIRIQEGNVS